ncbi:hypothetical protein FY133_00815 [Agrobacterium tumefaciens]|uniref:hypothetical protein n=1 Tax=Agrobacterium tumefaciens TaxID=358 RepID=UPI0021D155A1|nr:hypothetical protein [Agrobacterium tumefaciens]UXT64189.1 hypothetical protein FY133_00815 [Agrobacterium tumefaciens]
MQTARLLPKDQAPPLRVSGPAAIPTKFDRLSFVVLWNLDCGGCLPIVQELAEIGAGHNVPCHGVAVMVRDTNACALAIEQGPSKAMLAFEQPGPLNSALFRGSVTRTWLEASGQGGLPAGFVIDSSNTIIWMGDPNDLKADLPSIFEGRWNVDAARERWASRVAISDVRKLQLGRDLFDRLAFGDINEALEIIEIMERELPSISDETDFCIFKMTALIGLEENYDTATKFYEECSTRLIGNVQAQVGLAGCIFARMPSNKKALSIAVSRLKATEAILLKNTDGRLETDYLHITLSLTLADAHKRNGSNEAEDYVDRALIMSHGDYVPERVRLRIASEIERIRNINV